MAMMKRCSSYNFLRFIKSFTAPVEKKFPIESLERILTDKLLCALFHEWAAQNLCSENLMFYFEVEKYKTIRDANFMKSEAFRVSLLVPPISCYFFYYLHIHAKYVRIKSVAEVNLDYECREAIENEILIGNATPTTFDEAKFVILDLIKYDLYLKFVDSDIYRSFRGLTSASRYPVNRRNNVHLADSAHLTYEQISSLSRCLQDPMALDEFLKFAYKEFSDGVVQFYLDVERYEQAPSIEFACTIYSKYLGDASEEEVDADPKLKLSIMGQLQHGRCPSDLFSVIKLQLYIAMVQDNFLRFQNHVISSLTIL